MDDDPMVEAVTKAGEELMKAGEVLSSLRVEFQARGLQTHEPVPAAVLLDALDRIADVISKLSMLQQSMTRSHVQSLQAASQAVQRIDAKVDRVAEALSGLAKWAQKVDRAMRGVP